MTGILLGLIPLFCAFPVPHVAPVACMLPLLPLTKLLILLGFAAYTQRHLDGLQKSLNISACSRCLVLNVG